ncbi:flagellar hook-length control protein FliK [Pseudocitrobacter cyperus]|uniref:Flagellar hook-length control protein FliK n=1 Tax=Pseudocitrobacter cyperus TaxID=3112843 RepID=A0ABV0HQD3_9ENTR
MNIDLATLLLGGTQGKGKAGLLNDEGFSLALDEKLASLSALFPGLEPEVLAALPETALAALPETALADLPETALPDIALPANLLPEQPTDDVVVADEEEGTALLLTAMPGLAEALQGVTLTEGEGEESPQWQLQQLVARNVAGGEPRVQAAAGQVNAEKPAGQTGKLASPLTMADKTPLATSGALSAQSTPVASETIATAEMPASPTASAIALPAAVRTSVAHAPQQVVTVNHPPETPEWKQSVSQHIAIFSRNGLHSAEIRLHPEDLGALQITLRVQQEQAQIHIVSEHAHVRHAMEQALPQLRAAMAESGIQLGEANVSADAQPGASGEKGENAPSEQQASGENDELQDVDDNVPTLLTTTPGNIYGINTFA